VKDDKFALIFSVVDVIDFVKEVVFFDKKSEPPLDVVKDPRSARHIVTMLIGDGVRAVKATLRGARKSYKALPILGARMSDYPDEPVPDVSAAAIPPPDASGLEIRARADDAIIGRIPVKKAEEGLARRASPFFERLLVRGPHAALVACLLGFAWLAGSYFLGDQPSRYVRKLWPLWTVAPEESVEHAETIRTAQKKAEEIRALKADVEPETSAAIAELAGRVERLERESAAKLSQIYERVDRIEHQIAAPTAAPLVAASESGATVARKRSHGRRSDAFDPSQNPNAPGVPRPLGSLAPD
jgi:hypothetical protein